MPRISCKPRKDGKTVALVRYPYSRELKKKVTHTYGSIQVDADPDDVRSHIRVAKKYRNADFESLLTVDDLVYIRSWLMEHGDTKARELRRARDTRVERDVLERLRANAETDGNPLAQVVKLLPAAGEMLRKFAEDCRLRGQEPWDHLRKSYLEVHAAIKEFEQLAKKAGVTKERRKTAADIASP
ncbi:hypothetical protein [Cupriavidus lacunae]|uniref:Uncharacterized protein n=1 Tax=Cupriavidus lacunae TaxID=2666307 RepID=A0A370NU91_9BURK|nr:hypothetical protein [Cupriavidus lacunae]RDK09154.1 hypothetical protein DN412_17085 [Cupriavidus lacunae]